MQKPARIKIVNRFGVTRSLPLGNPVFTIGRKAENDLQLLSDSVSRQHAEIVYEDDAYYLVDIGSKRGTFVNGQQIVRCALQHLDLIRIGGDEDQQITFLDDTIERASAIFDSSPRLTLTQQADRVTSANEELQKLARFIEVNQAFKFSLTPDDVLCLIVDAAIEITQAERGFLMLRNAAGDLEFKVARDDNRRWLEGADFAMSRSVVEEAFKQSRSVIINDSREAALGYARESVRSLDLRSIACIPLRRFQMSENMDATSVLKRDAVGVLYVDSHIIGGTITETSIRLLESLAFEATKSLESVRLMHEEREKKQIEQELGVARQVQVALSPTAFKVPDYFEIAAHNIPSRYVGGDFYDFISLPDNRSAFALGDVSGKGVAAGLLAAMAQGALQAQFTSNMPLAEVVSSLNKVLVQRSASNRFITLFCATLDPDGHFTYINAGHNLPVLARANGETETLTTKSVLLGAFDFVEYKPRQTRLAPGDVVVMYTDGVTEAVDADNQMFGEERLEKLVKESVNLSAEEIKQRILDEVLNFTAGLPQGDDITLIALKMK
ncbi:MAG TPA: SpoIIE family protein phosphatase [Blastocatellia bacterium]|jgi:serine phosphatase RsbU (regulator of sigma subunit)|nr:SpoIIE family protein phosphatase [Blastocatellia bacterium]